MSNTDEEDETHLAELKTRFFAALKTTLNPTLRQLGFKGSGRHFRRLRGEVINTLWIHTDKYGDYAGISLGLHTSFLPAFGLGPPPDPAKIKIHDCEFGSGVSSKNNNGKWPFLEFDSPEAGAKDLARTYFDCGERQFDEYDTVESIASMYTAKALRTPGTPEPDGFSCWGGRMRISLAMAWVNLHLGRFETASELAHLGPELGTATALTPYFEEVIRCCEIRSTRPAEVDPATSEWHDSGAG